MSSIIKSGWREIAGLLILNVVLCAAPFIFFGKEIKHYNGQLYFVAIKWVLLVLETLFLYFVMHNRDDPKFTWQRPIALGIAVAFCIFMCAHGATYRSDKSSNIEFDKTVYNPANRERDLQLVRNDLIAKGCLASEIIIVR